MKPKLVKFKNGKWGVRKFDWFYMKYLYIDLASQAYWWGRRDEYFPECQGTEERARECFDALTDKGKVVK